MRHSGSVHPVLLERPYLDRQRGRSRELASPLERRVEVGGPNDAETAEMLLAFREGAVGHEDLVTLQANHRRSARGMQPAVEDPRAGPLQLVPDGRNLAHDRCKHFWRRRLADRLIDAEQILLHFHGHPRVCDRRGAGVHALYERAPAGSTADGGDSDPCVELAATVAPGSPDPGETAAAPAGV